jgi:hypothetical protein
MVLFRSLLAILILFAHYTTYGQIFKYIHNIGYVFN